MADFPTVMRREIDARLRSSRRWARAAILLALVSIALSLYSLATC